MVILWDKFRFGLWGIIQPLARYYEYLLTVGAKGRYSCSHLLFNENNSFKNITLEISKQFVKDN